MKNDRFEQFRAQLEERGYSLRALWGGKSHPAERFEDVTCYSVHGTERPAVGTIVVRHYDEGRNGFGLWLESPNAKIAADVRSIIDRQRPTPKDIDAIRAGLDYASAAFEACSTSPDVEWRREDDDKLTRAREALEKLERFIR